MSSISDTQAEDRLFDLSRRFIESYMTGCNHDFDGELKWREYPTDNRESRYANDMARAVERSYPTSIIGPRLTEQDIRDRFGSNLERIFIARIIETIAAVWSDPEFEDIDKETVLKAVQIVFKVPSSV